MRWKWKLIIKLTHALPNPYPLDSSHIQRTGSAPIEKCRTFALAYFDNFRKYLISKHRESHWTNVWYWLPSEIWWRWNERVLCEIDAFGFLTNFEKSFFFVSRSILYDKNVINNFFFSRFRLFCRTSDICPYLDCDVTSPYTKKKKRQQHQTTEWKFIAREWVYKIVSLEKYVD